jgi:hypothetical protein
MFISILVVMTIFANMYIVHENKNTTAWNIIKENQNSDSNHQEREITIEREKETDLQKIADYLNKNFIEPSIDFTEEQREACLRNVPRINDSKFNLKVVYPWDVRSTFLQK